MAAWRGMGQERYASPLLQNVMEEHTGGIESPACTDSVVDIAQLWA